MTGSSITKRALLSSIIALILCFSTLVGVTFAWFTDGAKSEANIIKSGTLDVSMSWLDGGLAPTDEAAWQSADAAAIFDSALWRPGYIEARHIKIANEGTLPFKYQIRIVAESGFTQLADVIDVYYLDPAEELSDYAELKEENKLGSLSEVLVSLAADETAAGGKLNAGEKHIVTLALKMQETVGNEYQGLDLGAAFDIVLYATQTDNGNGFDDSLGSPWLPAPRAWNGTIDTSWYDPTNPQTEYKLGTAEQIAGLSELVAGDTTFAGVTITLTSDIDLYCEDTTAAADGDPLTFRPIGDHSKNGTFEGVFDGNGHTISNIYQNGWDLGYEWGAYGSYGLFGNLNNATVKNLTLSGGESYIEGGDVSFVAGSATGTCVFENITIKDSVAATYNNGCGGIIGWSGAGNYTFKDITIAEDVVLGGLWGSFDSSIGGIVGQAEPGATYTFENVTVACRIDAYNDCTASYDYYNYRMCGMLIGRMEETTTIDGTNYPDADKYNLSFENVTVIYGDWANYHYCRTEGKRAARVEPGYQYDGLPDDYDHSTCTKHHMEEIPFDQIFGGDQYGVKGLKAYAGVTVVYPND